MRALISLTFCGISLLGTLAFAQAGSGGAQRYVAIGCLSRQGTAAAPRFVLTDPRGERPTVYRLDGDRTLLAQHVGHQVEATGTMVSGGNPATLRVSSLVWLASRCTPAAAAR